MSSEQALNALKGGRLAEAEKIYRQILSGDPRNFDALHMMGIICADNGRFDEAERFFQSALEINPTSVPCSLNFGLYHFKQQHHEAAIALFDSVLAQVPNYAPAYSDRGCALAELGRLEEAAASHNKAVSLAPNAARAWYNRAFFMHYKMQDTTSALRDYDQALRCDGKYADAWNGRGNVHNGLKRHDDALAAYDKAIALKPDLAEAWLGRGNTFSRLKRFDEAIESYEKSLDLKSDLAQAWNGRGIIFTILKKFDQANVSFDNALTHKPDSAEAWLGRGALSCAVKQYDQAFAAYNNALALKPDFAEAWLGRGRSQLQLERIEDAIADYRQALAFGGDRATILYELAQFGAEEAPAATPRHVVKDIFDDYADNFDNHLVNKLKYQTPEKLLALIRAARVTAEPDVLDLGCGTGLMGEKLRPIAKTLCGVDLSENMLKKAEQRAIYDGLFCEDITEFLSWHPRQYDLVVAADVFVYLGDLTSTFERVRESLEDDGLFCFSVEAIDTGDVLLRTTGRYAHSLAYLNTLAATYRFSPEIIEPTVIRQESGKDVAGYTALMRCS
jgi:predicted TPR repeat methyltransferase